MSRFHETWTILVTMIASSITLNATEPPSCVDLAGTWALRLDPEDRGVEQAWYSQQLPQRVRLPGSLPSQDYGETPRLDSAWTGTIRPEVIQMPRYAPYRDPDNFKMPFWLQPLRYYVGPAWYQRDVHISPDWAGRRITLYLERCHWFTQVWVDDQPAGKADSLSTPHVYDLTELLTAGQHRLTIRVDNRVLINVGHDSHSVTDHTQTNWNGIVGDIQWRTRPAIAIDDVQVYPDTEHRTARVRMAINNHSGADATAQLNVAALQDGVSLAGASVACHAAAGTTSHEVLLQLGDDVKLWSEHAPHLCRLQVSLHNEAADPVRLDQREVTFGMRQLAVNGNQFLLNGQPIYFRGTLECCIFPLTGFPPTDVDSWKRIVRRCKEFGLNHIRFHSWCPPEAAFVAADELGFYYQVECASWANGGASVGNGTSLDQWLYDEADRILKAYGNHPSFMLFAYGNEPAGPGPRQQGEDYLAKWVNHYKQAAPRQLITCSAGWPYLPENHFHVMHHPLRQHGAFNRETPSTARDYSEHVRQYPVPLISHETGQWCVFPDLDEMSQYTGVLRARNFEIVRDFLEAHHLLPQARDFLMASGALQHLLYKEEIEIMLRTKGLGGFQLLDLHDFPGQGTALVGLLNPFWEPKPYITAEVFRQCCGPIVPLARLDSRIWSPDQSLVADVEVHQFGPADLLDQTVTWNLSTEEGQTLGEGQWENVALPRGGLRRVGELACPLAAVTRACRLRLTVTIPSVATSNQWDLWVYPQEVTTTPADDILVTRALNQEARAHLDAGGKLLFLPPRYLIAGDTHGSFETIFWNRLWFPTQSVHTLGILCDPTHPALADFPTQSHSNWQWWDLCNQSKPLVLDELPSELTPIVQVIDDWNTCRRLALVLEAQVGAGKVVVCGIDLEQDLDRRPAARQLRHSLLQYMASDRFAPRHSLELPALNALLREPTVLQQLEATVSADSQQAGFEASRAIDGNPDTMWHTAWGDAATPHPHELVLDLRAPRPLIGLTCQPRRDMSNGRIARFAVYVSQDGSEWGEPVASGSWPDTADAQTLRFPATVTGRYVKLVAASEVRGQTFASVAELDVLLAP